MNQTRTYWFSPENMLVLFAIMGLWADVFARWYPHPGYDAVFVTAVGMVVCMCHCVREKHSVAQKLRAVIIFLLLFGAALAFGVFFWLVRQGL